MDGIEHKIKSVYRELLMEETEKIIENELLKFKKELVNSANEIISKILSHVLISQNEDPIYLKTIIQIQLANVLIQNQKEKRKNEKI